MRKILLLSIFILVFFASMGFVSSATVSENQTSGSGSNPIITTVTHNTPVHGKAINITAQLKYANGTPYANKSISYTLRSRSDSSSQPEGKYSNAETTDSEGRLFINWKGNPGWFDHYDFAICDSLDSNQRPSGTVYFNKTFDFTIKRNSTNMQITISRPTVFEGQETVVSVYVTSNGNPVILAYLEWIYGPGSNQKAFTALKNGYSVFKYNSYNLGNNPITINLLNWGGTEVYFPGLVYTQDKISKSFNINVKAAPDLVIAKILRSANKYKVTVKNIGKGASAKTKLKLWYSKKKYKTITVAALGAGKQKTYVINFFKYNTHKKYKKYVQVNYNNAVYDKNTKNNKLGFKSNVAYGLAADLMITKVTRSGNNYIITIKNNGNLAASTFKLRLWYGSKTKSKGLITAPVKSFGQFGNKLPPGVSLSLTVPYYKYKTHSKYYKFVQVNHDKKLPELNYNNNLRKFKA